MSMVLIFAMITTDVQERIAETKGAYWAKLWKGENRAGFSREHDVFDDLDYRDLLPDIEDEESLLYQLVHGKRWGQVLVEGYEWTYGPPTYFSPAEVKLIYLELKKLDDGWPMSEIIDFFRRAAAENKGVILGAT